MYGPILPVPENAHDQIPIQDHNIREDITTQQELITKVKIITEKVPVVSVKKNKDVDKVDPLQTPYSSYDKPL